MKLTTALLLSSTIALATANTGFHRQKLTYNHRLLYDPNTISPCIQWYTNIGIDSCEDARSMFGTSPEDFHKWNPSVGLDCKPWNVQSYCVLSEERLDSSTATASKEATASSKSAAETASSRTDPIATSSKATTVTTTTATAITTSTQSSGGARNRGMLGYLKWK